MQERYLYLGVSSLDPGLVGRLEELVGGEILVVCIGVVEVDIVEPKVLADLRDIWRLIAGGCGRSGLLLGLAAALGRGIFRLLGRGKLRV